MLLGLYFAGDYLKDMLTASYFGEEADVFICTRDGKLLASSGEGNVRSGRAGFSDGIRCH